MSNTTDTKRPDIQRAKSKVFSKYLKKNIYINEWLHIRDNGVFGFSFFSVKLGNGGDEPFLCKKFSCIIERIGLNGHTLRDIYVDG